MMPNANYFLPSEFASVNGLLGSVEPVAEVTTKDCVVVCFVAGSLFPPFVCDVPLTVGSTNYNVFANGRHIPF